MNEMSELFGKLSVEDIEKLKVLFSLSSTATKINKSSVTLRVFCEEYEEFIKKNRSFNYYKSVESSLIHLKAYFGEQKPLIAISYRETEMFITYLQENVKKGYRVYYRTIKAAFNKALDWNYIGENHFVKVKLPKKVKLNPVFITEDDLCKILENIDVEVVKDVVTFAFYTGLRLNEIVNLRWCNVDFAKNAIVVGDEEFMTKGKNQRYVPMSDEVSGIVKKRLCRDKGKFSVNNFQLSDRKNFVFAKDENNNFTGDYFSRRFKAACKKGGMDESVHFHTLRHSFASHLAQKGVSLYVIKELLGHSSISTTEIYSHLNMDSLREAVDKLNGNGSLKAEDKADEVSSGLRLVKL